MDSDKQAKLVLFKEITKTVPPANVEFVLGQCEKVLQRTIEDRASIQKRYNYLLGILGLIISLGFKWMIESLGDWGRVFWLPVLVELSILVVICVPLIYKSIPSLYAGHGLDPDDSIRLPGLRENLIFLHLCYADQLQARIDFNRKTNLDNTVLIRRLVFAAVISPFIVFGVWCAWLL